MEGVTIIRDETTNKRYAKIDIALLDHADAEELMDLIDVIIAESRADEETLTSEEVTDHLKKIGKL